MEVEGFGLTIEVGDKTTYDAAGIAWTEITGAIEYEPAEVSIDKIPTQTFGQANKTKTYQAGWKDPGEAKVTIHFDKAQIDTIETTLLGVQKGWQITYADGSKHQFNGYVSRKGMKVPLDNLIAYEFSIQQSGDALFTPAA